jgi:putative peptidoglycan lipid II flippase
VAPISGAYSPRTASGGRGVVAPVTVAGDVVLTAQAGASDFASASAARLRGQAIALAGLVVVAGVVLSRILGFVRVGVLNAEYGGLSPQLAAFNFAFRIPDTLFQLVAAGAVGSALVPVASELIARGEDERARRLIGTITNMMIFALLPLVIVAWVLAPMLVSTIVAPNADPAQQHLTTELTRWLLFSPVLLGIGAVMTAGLNALGIFKPPAMAPNVYNIAIIVAAIVLTPFFGVYALVLGVVAGAAGHVATQLPSVARHKLYRPVMDLHEPAVRQTLKLIAPRAFGLGVTQIVFFFYVSLISGNSDINIWTTAFVTLQIPVGLIGVPLGIVLLPPLSQAFARGATSRFSRLVDQSLRLLIFVVLPLTGVMFVLAGPGLTLLWGHGSYTPSDVAYTTSVFTVFLFGLVAHVLIALLAPIFYAGKDTRTPVGAALVAVAVDIVGAAVLFPFFHLQGLALAIGLGAWAEVAMLLYLIERRVGFDLAPIGRGVAAFLPGAVLASGAALVADRLFTALTHNSAAIPALCLELGLAGAAGLATYAAWGRLLHLTELTEAIELVRTLTRKRART